MVSSGTITGFRLSAQQERSWIHAQSSTRQFVSQCAALLEGELDATRLQAVLRHVVLRHEALRTGFHRQAGIRVPFQIIRNDGDFAWEICTVNDRAKDSSDRLNSARKAPFELESGRVLRVRLEPLSAGKNLLVLSVPALCGDARSLRNLLSEIAQTYATGTAPAADGVMQYVDFVEWQHELLNDEDTKAARDFWREYARRLNLAESISLPCERKAEPGDFLPRAITVDVDPELLFALNTAASILNTASSTLLFACWTALLFRMTGDGDLTVGYEFDGRKYDELASAVGLFATALPIASHADPETSFQALVRQIENCITEAQQWQESFAWNHVTGLDEPTGPELQVQFAYHECPPQLEFGNLRLRIVEEYGCTERFKLKLVAVRQQDQLRLQLYFDESRLAEESVRRLASSFECLLRAAVQDPESPVSRLPLLGETERRQLLVEWNQTSTDYPRELCLQQWFEQQAERTPERTAVRCGERHLSYRQLNQQANQLAHYLRRLGVGPDALVGLCVERSAEMMVAVLAILKAGGAYVALNADNPKPRLKQQLHQVVVLISEQKLLPQMPEFAGTTLCLDGDEKTWTAESCSNPAVITTPENLAYVIYTSGSTGVPKGVAVRHRNLVNYTQFICRRLQLEQYPEGLQFASVSTLAADLGNTAIYPALVSGGCLHVIAYEVSTDAQRFAAYNQQYGVEVLKIVPSHLEALLHGSEARQVLPAKWLITGGETLSRALVEKVVGLGPACRILNHYGPTETTVGSLTLEVTDYDWRHSAAASIPIGRPIANTQVYILDPYGEPVPMGVTGELYIAGAGVTAGYLQQPERAAERFVPDPFSDERDAKMYRTGDLARYWPDGNVEFLGRSDDQVKIRGFRIELGEIESLLLQCGGVKQAVAVAREDERGDKRLVGYVVTQREAALTSDELRAYLQEQLPDYMVPAALVLLPKLPLTANGKLDRQALPAPEQAQSKTYVAPRTPTEEIVAHIWAEVLRLNAVGVNDDFFQIGGHSLLATQVISRLRSALNIELPLRTLFESPTVAKLTTEIEKCRHNAIPTVPPITKAARDGGLPLSFAQQRLWVLGQLQPNNPLYNIPRALRMKGKLNIACLEKALNEIVRRHESQRTTFQVSNGNPVQVIAAELTIALRLRELAHVPEEEREAEARRLASQEAELPFDLAQGPLIRATLLRLSPEDHVLLLTMHHIVSDAWSADVLLRELGELYQAFLAGRPSPLPELSIQYADYAVWQRGWLQGDVMEREIRHWREQLKGAPSLLQLPTDRPRPAVQSFRGASEIVPLSPTLSQELKRFSQREGVTLFMTLLGGFQALLSRYSGQEQIVIGTDMANRTTTETEGLIGFFINLLALRTDLSGNPSFRELLKRVRRVALDAYAHQDMPFDKLVEELQPERSLSYNPLVQTLFVMQNVPRHKRELQGITISAFPTPLLHSKFDLAVFMVDGENGLSATWVYSTDLFEVNTIRRMAQNYETLLGNALAHPDARLSSIEIMSDEEKRQRGADRTERKKSQLQQLKSIKPKAVSLAGADLGDKE